MGVGQNIKSLRKKKGLQQKELAAMIGQTATSIMHYEKEDRKPSQEVIEKIATALNVSPTTLLDWDDWEKRFNHNGNLSREAKLIDEIKLLFGKEASQLLEMFIELDDIEKEKSISYLEDMSIISNYKKLK